MTGFAVLGKQFREPDPGFDAGFRRLRAKVSVFDGFRRVRFCFRGLDGTGSGNRVWETRGIKKVPGSGVPKVTFYFERALCTLIVYFVN